MLFFTLFYFLLILGGLSLPCHLLCCLLLFFVCLGFFCLFFFSFFPSWIFCFFIFMDFLGFFFFLVILIALGTSSLRLVMSPLGVGCTSPPFRGRISKGSKLCN